jgi:hypothetical protein
VKDWLREGLVKLKKNEGLVTLGLLLIIITTCNRIVTNPNYFITASNSYNNCHDSCHDSYNL